MISIPNPQFPVPSSRFPVVNLFGGLPTKGEEQVRRLGRAKEGEREMEGELKQSRYSEEHDLGI